MIHQTVQEGSIQLTIQGTVITLTNDSTFSNIAVAIFMLFLTQYPSNQVKGTKTERSNILRIS